MVSPIFWGGLLWQKIHCGRKKGRVFAVVVNPDEYETLKKSGENEIFGMVDDIQKQNKDKNIGAVMKDVTAGGY